MDGDKGGPAFPYTLNDWQGMTLRDWFAGQALAGFIAHNGKAVRPVPTAADCYFVADAMLAERSKP